MRLLTRPVLALSPILLCLIPVLASAPRPVQASPREGSYWQVEDVRPGMKGYGRTVMKGTRIETFQVEVLGVLRNTNPGRDMILCRLSGLNLDKTGVIAGMSGSPIYIDDKLLGAVAYGWAYGKEPIAGVTPFCQMHGFVEAFERRDLAEQQQPTRIGLHQPLTVDGKDFDTVTVSHSWDDPEPTAADGIYLMPLRTPLAATGFTPHALKLLRDRCGKQGLVPMQGGGAPANLPPEERNVSLEPGGPLSVSLITGDFDLSGIGTVTHIEGERVYGWGHPFMSLGTCEFPLMTGYIHTIYPRQTVSFKMGSPLRTVGVINADVSTGIAGWLGRKPDMLPMSMRVALGPQGSPHKFHVQLARQRTLLSTLVFTALTNSVDMEGELPEELTAEMSARIELDGHPPVVLKDTFSGFAGGRAPQALYSQVAQMVQTLTYNPHQSLRINRIDCETRILPGRRVAEIEAVQLDSEVYAPGETVKAAVFVRPFKGSLVRIPVALRLPVDLPEGNYTVTACDDPYNTRLTLRNDPNLFAPQSVEQVLESLQLQMGTRRTNLVLRIPVDAAGVAIAGKSLPNLPPSMVHILGNSRRTGAQTMSGALTARKPTDWVIQGTEAVRIQVTKNPRILRDSE